MATVNDFEKCLDGRTEFSFLIELGQLYFFVASDAKVVSVLIFCYWCARRIYVEVNHVV